MNMISLNFFKTAPNIRSEKVVRLIKSGRANILLEAIENEKNSGSNSIGESKDGKVTVKRVGAYAAKQP